MIAVYIAVFLLYVYAFAELYDFLKRRRNKQERGACPVDYEAVSTHTIVLVPLVAFGVAMLYGWSWAIRNCKKQEADR